MKVREMLFKFLAIIMMVSMLVSMAGAVSENTRVSRPNVEIIIDDAIDYEKAQLIIATINGDEIISPRSILCVLGHSKAQTSALGAEHRVWSTSPRCRETIYDVTYCKRSGCDYVVYTIRSQTRVTCC